MSSMKFLFRVKFEKIFFSEKKGVTYEKLDVIFIIEELEKIFIRLEESWS